MGKGKLDAERGPFVVWSPDGETPPKLAHPTHQAAHHAAHMLAKSFPEQTFFVMGRMGKPITAPVEPAQQGE